MHLACAPNALAHNDAMPKAQPTAPWVELLAHYPGAIGLTCLIDGHAWPCPAERAARDRKLARIAERAEVAEQTYLHGWAAGRIQSIDTIIEAWNELERRFPWAKLRLDVKHDPEGGHNELWLDVGVHMAVAELHRRQDAFDEEWWLDRAASAGFAISLRHLIDQAAPRS